MKSWFSLAVMTIALAGCDRVPPPLAPPKADEVAPRPAIPADDKLQTAIELKRAGKLAEARTALLEGELTGPSIAALNEIDTQLLFTPSPSPQKVDHTVAAGDTLGKLASKYGTTIEMIRRANNLTGDKIRLGDRLRIYQGKFSVDVNKTENILTVSDAGKFFKRYRVGTGQFSKTPVGDFKITTRIENPPWYRGDGKTIPFGDPANILGTHWLGLNVTGYGIHGTWDTNSIGKEASAGCVRLLNNDVAELYTMLPIGTPVTIHE